MSRQSGSHRGWKLSHRRATRFSALRSEALERRQMLAVGLVSDILPGSNGSTPGFLAEVGDTLYFAADDGTSGRELWTSDGTTAGTVRVADVRLGSVGSVPSLLTEVQGTLYFRATDGTSGYELFRSDGTAGAVRVADIQPGGFGSTPSNLIDVAGTVYFSANDGTSGFELWKSDGTEDGTVRVADTRPGNLGSFPSSLTNVGGTVYFSATDGTSGYELWKSDGSTAGTVRVADIRLGASGSDPGFLANVGGTLFFTANDGTGGVELWKSNGTSAGTVMVADIRIGTGLTASSFPEALYNLSDTLYFTANDGTNGRELWRSDGSQTGTTMVRNIRPGASGSYPRNFANVSGTLHYAANDGTTGEELWRSDGTSSGTTLIRDIRSGPLNSTPRYLTNAGGTLYFTSNDGSHGYELWRSNGTQAGTTLVQDIRAGTLGSSSSNLTNVGGALFLAATDGAVGVELWRTVEEPPTLGSNSVTLTSTLGTHPAYPVPVGSGEQLRTVPVARVDRISLAFGKAVDVDQADLTVAGSLQGSYTFSAFNYDPVTFTGTWTLSTVIVADQVTITLNADGVDPVVDLVGNPLDGEWDNPTDLSDPSSSTVSGNGTPGGDFIFRFTVLSGDANRNNTVTGADYTIWADDFDNGQGAPDKLTTDGDWNGDGHVTGGDYTLWADHFGLDFTGPASEGDAGSELILAGLAVPRTKNVTASDFASQPQPLGGRVDELAAPRVGTAVTAGQASSGTQSPAIEPRLRKAHQQALEEFTSLGEDWLEALAVANLAASRRS